MNASRMRLLATVLGTLLARDASAEGEPPPKAEVEPELEIEIPPEAPVAKPKPPGDASDVHKAGEYGGVIPGRGTARSKKTRAPRQPTVTWVGFQVRDEGGARVFVRVTSPVVTEQKVDGGELIVNIVGARMGPRNNTRPLDTRFFETDVARVSAAPIRGDGVRLRVAFKSAEKARAATVGSEAGPDGQQYLFLDI